MADVVKEVRESFFARAEKAVDTKPTPDHHRVARVGYLIILITFGVIGGWAAFAPLGSAAIAPGVVTAQSSRRTIQHLEGGIVRKIFVREGSQVKAGDVMFELDPTQANANLDVARNQLASLMAQEARLQAERDKKAKIDFPPELAAAAKDDAALQRIIADEEKTFYDRQATLQAQLGVLRERKNQTRSEMDGIDRQRRSYVDQLKLADEELASMNRLLEKGLVPKPQVTARESNRAQLDGTVGRLVADYAKAQQAMSEIDLQIRQVQETFFQQVSEQIVETRVKKSDLQQREVVAADLVKRVNITAPVTGSVQGLRVLTEGAVVRPGEPMAEVVPANDALDIQAHFSPANVDYVKPEAEAEVRFPTFPARSTPMIKGRVLSISRDRMVDEATHQPYFLAVVKVDTSKMSKDLQQRLQPGIPAEVIVGTGERTMLQYLLEPLGNTLRHSMREQ
jgi:HlyD family secretion protein/S-layer protein transport system membrane fusion protein